MNYKGVIIEESLENKDILKDVKILETKVEEVVEEHKTPWIKQWTLHTVEIPENQAKDVAGKISKALDSEHNSVPISKMILIITLFSATRFFT